MKPNFLSVFKILMIYPIRLEQISVSFAKIANINRLFLDSTPGLKACFLIQFRLRLSLF